MNPNSPIATRALVASVALLTLSCTPPDASRADRRIAAYLQLAAAEDGRPRSGRALATLIEATGSEVVFLRQSAVRALGRLESPDRIAEIEPLLDDPAPAVRAEAANALAQAVHRVAGDRIVPALLERVGRERDPAARAALARSLGRSASSDGTRREVSAALVELSRNVDGDAPIANLVGVALGFEALIRNADGRGLGGDAATRLAELGTYGLGPRLGGDAARVRALAYATLARARRLGRELLVRAMRDPDPGVRLVAAQNVSGLSPGQRPELLRRLLGDSDTRVALEALRQVSREPRTELYCRFLLAGTDPGAAPSIRLIALDGLARPCPQRDEQRRTLVEAASSVGEAPPDEWHVAARALLALTRVAPDDAAARLDHFVGHANPFARSYAARAATALGAEDVLRTLAEDPSPNVRTAALAGLAARLDHAIDELLLDRLADDDPQLLITVAGLLEESPLGGEAAGALLDAFERVSASGRETWRDARRALLERVAELGGPELGPRLAPYLADYDPVVADDVAELLSAWEGRSRTAAPEPLPHPPLPTPAEYRALEGAEIVLHMRGDGRIVIALDPWGATTNVFRFARLVEEGYFDGLTFHRWAPNFVIQGGSPNANEYQGDGPYTRDEVGRPAHWRGTVGISTRGRDTGDGQIFVNLIDNVRLNHDYTIVGTVVEGMDAVEGVLEGSVIERAELRRGG